MIYTTPFIIVYFYVAGRLRQSGRLNVGLAAAAAGAAVATLVTVSFARHSYAPWVILLWAIGAGSVITVLMAGTLGWWKRSGGPSDYPRRPPIAVAAMSFMTFGLYAPVWSGVLWRDLKGALRDNRMSPVGHALAMLVPFYGSYRLRAQFDASNQLLAAAQSGERTNARVMMMLSVASLMLVLVLTLPVFVLFAVLGLFAPFVTDFATCWIALGIIGFIVWRGQSSLNTYWELLRPGTPYRLTWLELSVLWIVAVAFLQTLLYVAGVNYYFFTR